MQTLLSHYEPERVTASIVTSNKMAHSLHINSGYIQPYYFLHRAVAGRRQRGYCRMNAPVATTLMPRIYAFQSCEIVKYKISVVNL